MSRPRASTQFTQPDMQQTAAATSASLAATDAADRLATGADSRRSCCSLACGVARMDESRGGSTGADVGDGELAVAAAAAAVVDARTEDQVGGANSARRKWRCMHPRVATSRCECAVIWQQHASAAAEQAERWAAVRRSST
jgi:hypothetical protein